MSIDLQLTGVRPAGEVLAASRRQVEPALREAVATLPPTMCRIAGYHFGWWDADGAPIGPVAGGKAIRPALALLAAEATGGVAAAGGPPAAARGAAPAAAGGAASAAVRDAVPAAVGDAVPAVALPAAVAVELVHNFSLIQDDVIDGDLTRRHRPTVWSVFGTGAAIVAADALLTLATEVLLASGHPATRPAIQLLNTATLELVEGQNADLSFEDRTDVNLLECLRMAGGKSGALLGCACALGATLAGATAAQVTLLRGFGEQLGVAFQLTDDLLGIWGDPEVTGKPAHSDLQRGKKSLPVVAALTSGTPAGAELAALYHRDRPLSDPELARAAELVELAGGRAWSRAHAGDLLTGALRMLQSAVDLTADTARAAAELGELARLVVHRDH